MWSHPAWVGRWFPSDTPQPQALASYATWCTTVEGNTTFYAVPSAETVRRWSELAPDDFQFCFKLPRSITHDRRLRNVNDELVAFLRRIQPLEGRLGPLQVQLPASFGPDDLPTLFSFLDGLPPEPTWAVEVRHPEFFAGGAAERPLDDGLHERAVNRVILDSRALFDVESASPSEVEARQSKPRLPVRPVSTATSPLVRLIGGDDGAENLKRWEPWVAKISDWLDLGLEPHVFTHTPDNVDALPLARAFWDSVAAYRTDHRQQPMQALPSPHAAPEQLRLPG